MTMNNLLKICLVPWEQMEVSNDWQSFGAYAVINKFSTRESLYAPGGNDFSRLPVKRIRYTKEPKTRMIVDAV